MSIKDLFEDYFAKKIDAIQAIRTLSAMFVPSHAVSILVMINQITRIEQGDLDEETFRSLYFKDKSETK
jgi:hypothetical protein